MGWPENKVKRAETSASCGKKKNLGRKKNSAYKYILNDVLIGHQLPGSTLTKCVVPQLHNVMTLIT